MSLEVQVPESTIEALRRQYRLGVGQGDEAEFNRRLAAEMEQLLLRVSNWRLREPTAAQLAYAISICRQLGISLPEEAAGSRGEMQKFIAIHSLRLSLRRP